MCTDWEEGRGSMRNLNMSVVIILRIRDILDSINSPASLSQPPTRVLVSDHHDLDGFHLDPHFSIGDVYYYA